MASDNLFKLGLDHFAGGDARSPGDNLAFGLNVTIEDQDIEGRAPEPLVANPIAIGVVGRAGAVFLFAVVFNANRICRLMLFDELAKLIAARVLANADN